MLQEHFSPPMTMKYACISAVSSAYARLMLLSPGQKAFAYVNSDLNQWWMGLSSVRENLVSEQTSYLLQKRMDFAMNLRRSYDVGYFLGLLYNDS